MRNKNTVGCACHRTTTSVMTLATILLISLSPLLAKNTAYSGHIKSSYERLYLPGHEVMGLVRVGALFDLNRYVSFGPELYAAVTGQRGGFITMGVEGEVHVPFGYGLYGYGGLYLGAGGGGSAPQGGGLMVRPSLGLGYDTDMGSLEVGVSRVWYPNGSIDSTQMHVGFSVPFGGRFWRGHDWGHSSMTPDDASSLGVSVHGLVEHYRPAAGSHNAHSTTPTTPYTLAGAEFVIGSDAWYGYMETAGAGAGQSTGYMELFGGLGYRLKFGEHFSLGVQGAIGAGGGGRVDTGGGWMYRADGLAEVKLFDHLALSARVGKIGALDGSFSATSYGATLGYRAQFYGLGDSTFAEDADLSAWRVRLIQKSYLPAKGMFDDGHQNRIDLLGLSLNRFLTPHFYLIGESYWAWQGKAGGYAEGVLGLGWQSNAYHGWRLYSEAEMGVGGGGGVHMEGGFFGSLSGGISYDLNDATELYLGAAYVRSKTGGFRTQSVTAGITYNFSLFTR